MMSMHERSSLLWDVSADLLRAVEALKAALPNLEALNMRDEHSFLFRTIPGLYRICVDARNRSDELDDSEYWFDRTVVVSPSVVKPLPAKENSNESA